MKFNLSSPHDPLQFWKDNMLADWQYGWKCCQGPLLERTVADAVKTGAVPTKGTSQLETDLFVSLAASLGSHFPGKKAELARESSLNCPS